MSIYLLKLHSDSGTVSLYIVASNEETAKHIAMECELCPERAIYSIRKLKKIRKLRIL